MRCAIPMTSQITCKVNQLRESTDFLTLIQGISIGFEKMLIKRKNVKKVKIRLNMASKIWLPWQHLTSLTKIYPGSSSPINVSKGGKVS